MVRVEGVLREFACWLAGNAPEVGRVADLRRRHIEAYKLHLAGLPSARGGNLSKISLAEHTSARCAPASSGSPSGTAAMSPPRRAGVLRRPAAARRATAPLPGRRRVHQTAAGHPRRPRPVRPPGRGIPGPHRPAQRRVPGPHRRLRRADRRRLLAPRAARQAAHRPLYPAAPPSSKIFSTPGSPHGPPACAALTCSPSTASASGRAASTGPSPESRPRRRDRPRQPAQAQAHAGHPGHQPGHEP